MTHRSIGCVLPCIIHGCWYDTHALVRSLDVGELNVAAPPLGDRRSCLLVEFGFPRGVRVLVLHPLLP
jgi:hypothetical protein